MIETIDYSLMSMIEKEEIRRRSLRGGLECGSSESAGERKTILLTAERVCACLEREEASI